MSDQTNWPVAQRQTAQAGPTGPGSWRRDEPAPQGGTYTVGYEYAGQLWVFRCEVEQRWGVPCGNVIEVPWEAVPMVQDGRVRECGVHRGNEWPTPVVSAAQVIENRKRCSAAWDERQLARARRRQPDASAAQTPLSPDPSPNPAKDPSDEPQALKPAPTELTP